MEILLLFTDGNFDALGTTFMLSDWLAHTPLSVVAQNFNISTDLLQNIPKTDPYAFPASAPAAPLGQSDTIAVQSPQGEIPNPFVFKLSEQNKTGETSGGWIKVQDSTNFPVCRIVLY
jgi:oxalate decarboxylase/phosphoglucose isomerase-like protein (cupin superfamily)